MDQTLFYFSELESIEYAELEGLIDPKVDAAFTRKPTTRPVPPARRASASCSRQPSADMTRACRPG